MATPSGPSGPSGSSTPAPASSPSTSPSAASTSPSPSTPPSQTPSSPPISSSAGSSTPSSNPASPSSDPSTPTDPSSPTSPSLPPTPPPSSPPSSPPPTSPSSPPPTTPPTTPPTPPPTSQPPSSPPASSPTSDGGGNVTSQSSDPGNSASSTPPPVQSSGAGSVTGAASSSSTPLPSSITSTSESTFLTTNAMGQTITSTVETTIVITASRLPGSSGNSDIAHSSSHTGAIVGGVVGGVGGLLALFVLGWWFLKQWRRKHEMDEFDGDFDPDRVVGGRVTGGGGNLDLAAGEGRVVPYSYTPSGPSEMAQTNGGGSIVGAGVAGLGAAAIGTGKAGPPPSSFPGNRVGPSTAPSAYSQPSAYSTSDNANAAPYGVSDQGHSRNLSAGSANQQSAYAGHSDPGGSGADGSEGGASRSSGYPTPTGVAAGAYAAQNVNDWRHPSPGPSLPHTSTSGTLPSTKEMEARGLRVANDNSGPVVQHQDGGRVEDEHVPPAEIPPSYDSIRRD